MKKLALIWLLGSVCAAPVFAADSAAGEQKSEVCGNCHGDKGRSTNDLIPNLAGQPAPYIISQLNAFKAGKRSSQAMKSMAEQLSDADMENLAAFFASVSPAKAGGDAALAKIGETKAAMCLGCHGDKAQGNGQFPRLAGQLPDYLSKQLHDFKDGTRKSGSMKAIAATLSEEDIKALAAYFAGL